MSPFIVRALIFQEIMLIYDPCCHPEMYGAHCVPVVTLRVLIPVYEARCVPVVTLRVFIPVYEAHCVPAVTQRVFIPVYVGQ